MNTKHTHAEHTHTERATNVPRSAQSMLRRAARRAGTWAQAHAKWPRGRARQDVTHAQDERQETNAEQPSQNESTATATQPPEQPRQTDTSANETPAQAEQRQAEPAASAKTSQDERREPQPQAAEAETPAHDQPQQTETTAGETPARAEQRQSAPATSAKPSQDGRQAPQPQAAESEMPARDQPQQTQEVENEAQPQAEHTRAQVAEANTQAPAEPPQPQAADAETQAPAEPPQPQAAESDEQLQRERAQPGEPEMQAQRQAPQADTAAEREEQPHAEPQRLFDGTDETFRRWKLVGAGKLERSDGELHIMAGDDCGLAYYADHGFDDFRLRLQYRPSSSDIATTAVVHFLDPEEPVPDRDDPSIHYPYENRAYVAPHTGFEVQLAAAQPGDDPGTFEGVLLGDAPGAQLHDERADVKAGDWNELEIRVEGNCHVTRLNGKQTASFANPDAYRGKPTSAAPHAGFIGLFMRKGEVWLRDIELEEPAGREKPANQSAQPTH